MKDHYGIQFCDFLNILILVSDIKNDREMRSIMYF